MTAFAAGLLAGLLMALSILPKRERMAYREGRRDELRRFERNMHRRWRSERPPPS